MVLTHRVPSTRQGAPRAMIVEIIGVFNAKPSTGSVSDFQGTLLAL
jgi:hypothetical protein